MRHEEPALGAFVDVDGSGDGVGKLVRVAGDEADVEYFVSPAGPALQVLTVARHRVRPVELSTETRVYWRDRSSWIVGRVVASVVSGAALRGSGVVRNGDDHYPVRFPNGREALLPTSEVFVRWRRPIADPTDHLAARVTETPFFYRGRAEIVRHLAAQRAAFGGLACLASAGVELLEHQVTAVRHVLRDPVRRYLLADEVGLGKTIQACALVRQHLLEAGDGARILIVVPEHLVNQWTLELSEKFFLNRDDPRVRVADDAHVARIDAAGSTMLVMDEAHRCARWAFSTDPDEKRRYAALCTVAEAAPNVLLLSGTPVLDNEDGFLAMLHILDPVGYPLGDRAAFRQRVRERQAIAELLADLGDTVSDFFVEDALGRVELLFPGDSALLGLVSDVRISLAGDSSAEESRARRRALRTHITETYRIHRRMLRTRREDPRLESHLPRRTGMTKLECDDPARAEAFDLIDTWRSNAALAVSPEATLAAAELMALLVDAAFSHPAVLLRFVDARIAHLSGAGDVSGKAERIPRALKHSTMFESEEELLRDRRTLLADRLRDEPRVTRLIAWLRDSVKPRKAVVFIDDRIVAERICEHLRSALGPAGVIRHDDQDAGPRFERDPNARVLVCDSSAEEGLNLQRAGAAVVHYDLPLAPNRIEQRIGRADRIAARGRLTNVVFDAAAGYERQWLACLNDVIRIFNRSTAPLQYVMTEGVARIRERLLEEGPSAITREATSMNDASSGLDAELRRIKQQEAIDALESDPESEHALFATLQEMDESLDQNGQEAFEQWFVRCLQFTTRRADDEIVRYSYSLQRPTLLPLYDVFLQFRDSIDRAAEDRSRRELPLKACSFSRVSAETAHVGLMRLGHPLVDAVESMVRCDDRGCAFAMWRVDPRWHGDTRLFLQFDFVVEADLAVARSFFGVSPPPIHALRRRADEVFPVTHVTVFLDASLSEITDPELIASLARPYRALKDGGSDINLRHDRWSAVDAALSVADWGDLCLRARAAAEHSVRDSKAFTSRCADAVRSLRHAGLEVEHQLRSRIAKMTGTNRDSELANAEFERGVTEAISIGISSPAVRLDAVGAIYISAAQLATAEPST